MNTNTLNDQLHYDTLYTTHVNSIVREGRRAMDFTLPSTEEAENYVTVCKNLNRPIHHVVDNCVSVGLTKAALALHEMRR